MGRMHSKGKGISRRCLPYRKTPPSWAQVSGADLTEQIVRMAKRGSSPSQIGVILRDQYGVPQVNHITGQKILRILKVAGAAPDLPEDLYHLIKKSRQCEKAYREIQSRQRRKIQTDLDRIQNPQTCKILQNC